MMFYLIFSNLLSIIFHFLIMLFFEALRCVKSFISLFLTLFGVNLNDLLNLNIAAYHQFTEQFVRIANQVHHSYLLFFTVFIFSKLLNKYNWI